MFTIVIINLFELSDFSYRKILHPSKLEVTSGQSREAGCNFNQSNI